MKTFNLLMAVGVMSLALVKFHAAGWKPEFSKYFKLGG